MCPSPFLDRVRRAKRAVATLSAAATAAALPLATARAETISLSYAAGNAGGGASAPGGYTSASVNTMSSLVNLSSGVPQLIELGSLTCNGYTLAPTYNTSFVIDRPLTLTLQNGTSLSMNYSLPCWFAGVRAGGAGQYQYYTFGLDASTAVYDFGSSGVFRLLFFSNQFTTGPVNYSGAIPIRANLSFTAAAAAVPEPGTGGLCAAGLLLASAVRFRRRKTA